MRAALAQTPQALTLVGEAKDLGVRRQEIAVNLNLDNALYWFGVARHQPHCQNQQRQHVRDDRASRPSS